jgi:hypothetical protein
MSVFLSLVIQILPLYFLIIMGWVSGKYMGVNKESLSLVAIYFLVPIVMFSGVMKTNISIAILVVPFIVFLISSISCLIVFNLSKIFLKHKKQANILAMMAGTGNSGYFGIPVAMMIFPAELVGVYITTVLGKVIFQNSVGIYITARGSYTVKDSFKKVFTIPVIYGFILAIILSHFSIPIAPFLQEFFDSIKGAYIVIGMMIIGLGIASMQKFSLDILFTVFAFTARFIIWPTIAFLIYQLDQATLSILNENIAKALILASIVPLAADSVAFASIMKCHPDETATAVLLSSIFSIFYVPLMIGIMF